MVLTTRGGLSRRQRLGAALAWAGDDAAIDGIDACYHYGLRSSLPDEQLVHVATHNGNAPRTRFFVVVRRRDRPLDVRRTDLLRYVAPADAVVAAGRRMATERQVLALFSEAVQRGIVPLADIVASHRNGPPRGRIFAENALEALGAGIRSAPEADIRTLMAAVPALQPVVFNRPLLLPNGRRVVPDALLLGSGVVHETNGRRWHAAEDRFDSMQERHDAMTECGLILLHNSPRRINAEPREVLLQIERTHAFYAGRGLPSGVVLLPENTGECHSSTF